MLSAARTVITCGLVFQVAGFARLLIIAALFGAGPTLDAYYLGLVIPTFLTGLSAAFWQSSFIPIYIRTKWQGSADDAQRFRNAALSWTALVLCVMTGILVLSEGPVLHMFWGSISPAVVNPLKSVFALIVWTAPLNGLADGVAMLLNAEGRFAAASSAPIINVLTSVMVLVWLRGWGVDALVLSLLAGLIAQIILVAAGIRLIGIRLRPDLRAGSGIGRAIASAGAPVLLGSLLANLVPAFVQIASAHVGPGALSALGYANRLHNSVVQTIVTSVSIVLLPRFAQLVAEKREHELRATLERVFAATLIFYLAINVFVAVSGAAAVGLLLEHGHFTRADGNAVASIWLALTGGLLGATWGIFLARLFQAQQRLWTIVCLGAGSLLLNVVLTLVLMPRLGVVGVAVSNSIAYIAVMIVYHGLTIRTLGPVLGRGTSKFAAKALCTNAAAYGGALLIAALLKSEPAVTVIVLQLCIVLGANLLLVRLPPLSIPIVALVKR